MRLNRPASWRGHVEVLRHVAQDLGLEDEDLFVLMQETPPSTSARRQRHAPEELLFPLGFSQTL